MVWHWIRQRAFPGVYYFTSGRTCMHGVLALLRYLGEHWVGPACIELLIYHDGIGVQDPMTSSGADPALVAKECECTVPSYVKPFAYALLRKVYPQQRTCTEKRAGGKRPRDVRTESHHTAAVAESCIQGISCARETCISSCTAFSYLRR